MFTPKRSLFGTALALLLVVLLNAANAAMPLRLSLTSADGLRTVPL